MKVLIALFVLILTACASKGYLGIYYDQDSGEVLALIKNSPAEKADIRIGDRIRNVKDLPGKPGTMCLVKVNRELTYFEKLVERVNKDKLEMGQW